MYFSLDNLGHDSVGHALFFPSLMHQPVVLLANFRISRENYRTEFLSFLPDLTNHAITENHGPSSKGLSHPRPPGRPRRTRRCLGVLLPPQGYGSGRHWFLSRSAPSRPWRSPAAACTLRREGSEHERERATEKNSSGKLSRTIFWVFVEPGSVRSGRREHFAAQCKRARPRTGDRKKGSGKLSRTWFWKPGRRVCSAWHGKHERKVFRK